MQPRARPSTSGAAHRSTPSAKRPSMSASQAARRNNIPCHARRSRKRSPSAPSFGDPSSSSTRRPKSLSKPWPQSDQLRRQHCKTQPSASASDPSATDRVLVRHLALCDDVGAELVAKLPGIITAQGRFPGQAPPDEHISPLSWLAK